MSAGRLVERLRDLCPTISVGMLTADLADLGAEMELLASTGVPLVHFDVMDGCFCPMTTFGPPVVAAVEGPLVKDVHLMVHDPLTKVGDYVAAGADMVTVHVEEGPSVHRALQQLGAMDNVNDPERGLVRGVALSPGTPVTALEPLLQQIDYVLLLAVNPGWGGQAFGVETPGRLEQARHLIDESGRDVLIGVDGGVSRDNIGEIVALGPDVIVTGSAVFDGRDPHAAATFMLDAVTDAQR